MKLAMVLDVVVILLLLATIGYAALLNRRLERLRAAKSEMEKLFHDFGAAASEALDALAALSSEGKGRLADLDRRIEQSRALADDLVFLIERGGKLADHLSTAKARPEAEAKSGKPQRASASAVAALRDQAKSAGADRKRAAPWLKSLQGMR